MGGGATSGVVVPTPRGVAKDVGEVLLIGGGEFGKRNLFLSGSQEVARRKGEEGLVS